MRLLPIAIYSAWNIAKSYKNSYRFDFTFHSKYANDFNFAYSNYKQAKNLISVNSVKGVLHKNRICQHMKGLILAIGLLKTL